MNITRAAHIRKFLSFFLADNHGTRQETRCQKAIELKVGHPFNVTMLTQVC